MSDQLDNQIVKLVMCSFPNIEKARQIGTHVIEKQLAACVNLIPEIESIYSWKGKIEYEKEVLCLFKTTNQNYSRLEAEILDLHPYETPEVFLIDIEGGSKDYLEWVFSFLASSD